MPTDTEDLELQLVHCAAAAPVMCVLGPRREALTSGRCGLSHAGSTDAAAPYAPDHQGPTVVQQQLLHGTQHDDYKQRNIHQVCNTLKPWW